MATNVTPQSAQVTRKQRSHTVGHRGHFHGCTVWLTGLSGAGKSTLAFALERRLVSMSVPAYSLDGDNLRCGLNRNLGFLPQDRVENIRRVSETAKLFADAGIVCIAALISPFREDRDSARLLHQEAGLEFFEIFVDTPLSVCEKRDVKGLYAKARRGQIQAFTGVDAEYQSPLQPQLRIDTSCTSVHEAVQQLMSLLAAGGVLPGSAWPRVSEITELPAGEDPELHDLPVVELQLQDAQWLQVIAEGWAHPLHSFMTRRQYLQCLHFATITDDNGCTHSQSVPIVLPVGQQLRDACKRAGAARLQFRGDTVAVLRCAELYDHRKEERCARIFGTDCLEHPAVAQVMQAPDWLLGGQLQMVRPIAWNDGLERYRLTPLQLKQKFKELRADAVFAFQLRNPIHNGHALLMRHTREQLLQMGYTNPVLLLHPLGGWTKDDDVPLDVRLRQHEAALHDGVLDPGSTVTAVFPSPMLYAGPTEVQWHAKARLNAGADFFIVGRDPAGIGDPREPGRDLYDPEHGAEVLQMAPGLTGLRILPFRVAAYDTRKGEMAFYDASRSEDFQFISGTKMRSIARSGGQPPPGFMAPAAWQVLAEYYTQATAHGDS